MKNLLFLLIFLFFEAKGVEVISTAASLKTLSDNKNKDSIFGDFFAPKGGVNLEEIMLLVEEDMNERGAVKVHLVVVYEKELDAELKKMSANNYFRDVDQMIKDHPDKLKIFEWELVAKKRIIPWQKMKYPVDHLTPIAAYIFAKYSGSGEYRAKIPPSCKKVKTTFKKKNFDVENGDEDKESKSD